MIQSSSLRKLALEVEKTGFENRSAPPTYRSWSRQNFPKPQFPKVYNGDIKTTYISWGCSEVKRDCTYKALNAVSGTR